MKPFVLRPWQENDLQSLVFHANNPKIAANLTGFFPYPYTEEAGKIFINFVTNEHDKTVFAIEIDNEAVGAIGIHPQSDIFCKNAELGYWLSEKYWGQGILTAVIKEMVTYAFEHYDIQRIFARPFGSNIASQKVLEKNKFVLEARFRATVFKYDRYEDELVYAIRRTDSF